MARILLAPGNHLKAELGIPRESQFAAVGISSGNARSINILYSGLLYEYQTLLTGILALIAAWWNVKSIRDQIDNAKLIYDEQRSGRLSAAKAVLPLALVEVTNFSQSSLKQLIAAYPEEDKRENHQFLPAALPTSDVMAVLRDCIEQSTTPWRENLTELLREIQIHYSRMTALTVSSNQFNPNPDYSEEMILDALEIYARCGPLFSYARGDDEHVNSVTISQMKNAASLNYVFDFIYKRLHDKIERRYK